MKRRGKSFTHLSAPQTSTPRATCCIIKENIYVYKSNVQQLSSLHFSVYKIAHHLVKRVEHKVYVKKKKKKREKEDDRNNRRQDLDTTVY